MKEVSLYWRYIVLNLFRSLGLPQWIVRCAGGELLPPDYTFDVPCNFGYGFPPALLPIWSNSAGPEYIGVWKHWYGRRKITFVRFDSETRNLTEIARTPEQLRLWVVFDLLCNVPDTEDVGVFAESLGLCSGSRLETYFRDYQDASDLARHPVFSLDLPKILTPNGPTDGRVDEALDVVKPEACCSFEVPAQFLRSGASPPWFDGHDQLRLFRELLRADNRLGAWMCLNSTGWRSSEMKIAIQHLARTSNIQELAMLSNFLSANVPDETGY